MKISEHDFLKLYDRFIQDMKTGRRLQANGKRIKDSSIDNYRYLRVNLDKFQTMSGKPLVLRSYKSFSNREWLTEKKYWKKFYMQFTEMLYNNGCHDNYVGSQVKLLKVFFTYIKKQYNVNTGDFYKDMYVLREEIDILVLLPDRLKMLIYDSVFESQLDDKLKWIKDIFVTGCTVALRFGDIMNLRWYQLKEYNGEHFLLNRSEKTGTLSQVKIPEYLMNVFSRYKNSKGSGKAKIFPPCSLSHFDIQIKKLFETAGWTEIIEKRRTKRGREKVLKTHREKELHRFCDMATSHMMRRTAITTMLMHGVPETVVRYISGHSKSSKSFYRYVAFVNPYINHQLDRHYARMTEDEVTMV